MAATKNNILELMASYVEGGSIDAEDYNGFAFIVNELYNDRHLGETGINDGGFGYGRSDVIAPENASDGSGEVSDISDLVSGTTTGSTADYKYKFQQEWGTLAGIIRKLVNHINLSETERQTITDSFPADIQQGDLIYAHDQRTASPLTALLENIAAKRFTVEPGNLLTTVDGFGASSTRTKLWSESLEFEFEAVWDEYNLARYFFNAGSSIIVTPTYAEPDSYDAPSYYDTDPLEGAPPGDPAENAKWQTLVDNVGALKFTVYGMSSENNVGTGNILGFYDLTNEYQTVYEYSLPSGYYDAGTSNRIEVQAKFGPGDPGIQLNALQTAVQANFVSFRVLCHSDPETQPIGGEFRINVDHSYSVVNIDMTDSKPEYTVVTHLDEQDGYEVSEAVVTLEGATMDHRSSLNLSNLVTVIGGSEAFNYAWRILSTSEPGMDLTITDPDQLSAVLNAGTNPVFYQNESLVLQVRVIDLYSWEEYLAESTINVIDTRGRLSLRMNSMSVDENQQDAGLGLVPVITGGSGNFSYQWSQVSGNSFYSISAPHLLNALLTTFDVPDDTEVTINLAVTDNDSGETVDSNVTLTIRNLVNYPKFRITSATVSEPEDSAYIDVDLQIIASEPVEGRNITVNYATVDETARSNSTESRPLEAFSDTSGRTGLMYCDFSDIKVVFDPSVQKYRNNTWDNRPSNNTVEYKMFRNIMDFLTYGTGKSNVLILGDNESSLSVKDSTSGTSYGKAMRNLLNEAGYIVNTKYISEVDSTTLSNYGAIIFVSSLSQDYPGNISSLLGDAIESAVRRDKVGLYIVTSNGNDTGSSGYVANANNLARRFYVNFKGSVHRSLVATNFDNYRATYGGNPIIDGMEQLTGSHAGLSNTAEIENYNTVLEPDFNVANASVTFNEGDSVKNISVRVLRDNVTETEEQFRVAITNLEERMLASNHEGIVTISAAVLPIQQALMFETLSGAQAYMRDYNAPTPAEVFNNWDRFSNGHFYPGGTAAANGADSYYYDASLEQIIGTENHPNLTGFVSPDKTSSLTFEATLSSDHNDDDEIDMIAAFKREGSVNHAILAFNTQNGAGYRGMSLATGWAFVYTRSNAANPDDLVEAPLTIRATYTATHNGINEWRPSARRCRIERDGPIIRMWVTTRGNPNGDPKDNPNSLIEVNTEEYPELAWVGNEPHSYGYANRSQPKSTWSNIYLEGAFDQGTVYVVQTDQVYVYNFDTEVWELRVDRTIPGDLGVLKQIDNPINSDQFVINIDGSVDKK